MGFGAQDWLVHQAPFAYNTHQPTCSFTNCEQGSGDLPQYLGCQEAAAPSRAALLSAEERG